MTGMDKQRRHRRASCPPAPLPTIAQQGLIRLARPPTPTRSSPPASICGSGHGPTGCAPPSCPAQRATVAERLKELALHRVPLSEGAVLETGCVYIVPLQEWLELPKGVSAAANPKSSTGRLDIFTRVITDHAQEFDKVPEGYEGPLYAEI